MERQTGTETKTTLPDAEVRRRAVEADVCPNSIRKLLRGEAVRGMAGARARRVLEAAGLLPAAGAEGKE